jgi:MFS family permease
MPGGRAEHDAYPVFRVNIVLLLLNAADGLVATLASAYLVSLGYPLADIGLLVSLYAVACLVARLPSARLAEGPHARRWLLAACAVFAATLALYPVAVEPWAVWSVRLLHGLSFGAATTLNFASFMSLSAARNRARATAVYTSSWAGGYSIGNLASGLLADHFGFGVAFVSSAICPMVALLLTPRSATRSQSLAGPVVGPSSWRLLFRADVRAIALLAFTTTFLNQLLTTLFPLYVLGIGQTLSLAGTARALQSVTNTVVRPLSGLVVRRLGPLGLGLAGVALTTAAIASVPLSTIPVVLLCIFVVVGAGRAVGVLANTYSTVELSERGVLTRGVAAALMSAGGDVGAIAAPILAGVTAAHIGVGPALQVLSIGAAILGTLVLLSGAHKS